MSALEFIVGIVLLFAIACLLAWPVKGSVVTTREQNRQVLMNMCFDPATALKPVRAMKQPYTATCMKLKETLVSELNENDRRLAGTK